MITQLVRAIFRLSNPLTLSGIGASYMQQAGVPNVAIEGMILLGCFSAFLGSTIGGSSLAGIIFAIISVSLVGIIYAILVLEFDGNVFAIGFVLNILITGMIAFFLRSFFREESVLISSDLKMLPIINLPYIERWEWLSAIFSGHSLLIFVTPFLVAITHAIIFHTPYGYWLRAAGKKPQALVAVGIDPKFIKFSAFVVSSFFCGLAGAHLSIGYLGLFALSMVAGRGFIVLAIVFFGRGNPFLITLATLIFGAAEAFATRIPFDVLPPQFSLMIPYLITLIAVTALEASTNSISEFGEKV